jgi:putative tryptophan/tyrosine transport system substrate-binding protein
VASLARPGGNATGISVQSTELAGKRLEIFREALPNLRRLAIIGDVGYAGSVLEISEVQAAARKVGVDIEVLEIRRAADIAPAFQALKAGASATTTTVDTTRAWTT